MSEEVQRWVAEYGLNRGRGALLKTPEDLVKEIDRLKNLGWNHQIRELRAEMVDALDALIEGEVQEAKEILSDALDRHEDLTPDR